MGLTMIKHEPQFDTQKIVEHYTKKDGVPVRYVCTSALGSEEFAMDIFYRDTPHPQFGNRYFGLYQSPMTGNLMITNADRIEEQGFGMIEDDAGNLHYSAHRHDYKVIDGKMIDGGRAYVKTNCHVIYYKVKDGDFVKETADEQIDTV
jgi:hypothetical protein